MPTRLGSSQSATASPNTSSVLISPRDIGPSARRSSWITRLVPGIERTSGRLSASTITHSATNETATTGTDSDSHCTSDTRMPSSWWMKWRPIRFAGWPIGVSSPPIVAPYAVISISAVLKRSRSRSASSGARARICRESAASTPSAIGSSIATTAPVSITDEIAAASRPTTTTTR